VTPKNRERAYEKRRYEEWQERLTAKQARNQRARRTSAIVGTALLAVAIIGGVFLLITNNDDDSTNTAAPAATPSAPAASAPASAPASATSAAAAKSDCPAVKVQPPASPQQFAKVPAASAAKNKNWDLTLKTTCGTIDIELDGKAAPQAVSSMLFLAKAGYFDGTKCHRLTDTGIFVLQCGDPTATGSGGPGYEFGPVENAPKDNVYKAGTIAMARQGGNAKSMGSQFFLVYKDSTIPSDAAGGYTVMGEITKGMDVLKKVAKAGALPADQSGNTAPVSAVSIASTTVSAG
jgi:peptidyl-prolyl cis-trans isomerase B (cyclophilin B)